MASCHKLRDLNTIAIRHITKVVCCGSVQARLESGFSKSTSPPRCATQSALDKYSSPLRSSPFQPRLPWYKLCTRNPQQDFRWGGYLADPLTHGAIYHTDVASRGLFPSDVRNCPRHVTRPSPLATGEASPVEQRMCFDSCACVKFVRRFEGNPPVDVPVQCGTPDKSRAGPSSWASIQSAHSIIQASRTPEHRSTPPCMTLSELVWIEFLMTDRRNALLDCAVRGSPSGKLLDKTDDSITPQR